jgi:hypothetical protein
MSTLNVANISDDKSTLTGSGDNLNDRLNFNTTVDTKFVTNGCAKVWANYDSTVSGSIRDSLNVSTITDSGIGNQDINFTNNMANTAYAICGMTSGWHSYHTSNGKLSDKMRMVGGNTSHAPSNQTQNNGFAFGDLA